MVLLRPLVVVVVVVLTDGDGISGGSRRLVPAPRAPTFPLPRTHSRFAKNGSRYAVYPALGEVLAGCRPPRRRIRRWTMMLAIDDDSFRVARSFASLSPHVGCHARISIALIPILSIDSPATSRPRAFTWCAPTASLFLSLSLSFSPASLVLDVASTSTNECVRADPVRRDRRSRISLRHAKINKMAASVAERLRSLPKCSNRTPIYVYYVCMYVCMRHARYAISADKLDSRRWSTRCCRTDRRENFTSIKGKITLCKWILYAKVSTWLKSRLTLIFLCY